MSLVPVLHPKIKRPLVFGWWAYVPLPPLATEAFDISALYPPGRILSIIIGPNMDRVSEAALQLFLSGSSVAPDVECISVIFHPISFNQDRLLLVEQYIDSVAAKEVRILDPASQYEEATITIKFNGGISQTWILAFPADDLNDFLDSDLSSSPSLINLKILPPRSAEKFRKEYNLIFFRLLRALRSTTRLQRLALPIDFMLKDTMESEDIFNALQRQDYLEELQLLSPTVFGIDEDPWRDNFLRQSIDFKTKFMKKLQKLEVPDRFIQKQMMPTENPKWPL
ncbi:hypothetical protein CPB84DRAFT_1847909 [Gymnopilus junonius]|uniref:Uncharacterized protein n=1 Tax=Gymnopilus junonius TaxID=109634 RepID=A0A9P5NJ74_GYMJU|nr:hypothetical protein CPB84DRAFT_1847909 [Gymnopilus junonius]